MTTEYLAEEALSLNASFLIGAVRDQIKFLFYLFILFKMTFHLQTHSKTDEHALFFFPAEEFWLALKHYERSEERNEGGISMGKLGTAALPPAGPAWAPEGEAAPQKFGEFGTKNAILHQTPRGVLQAAPRNCHIKH